MKEEDLPLEGRERIEETHFLREEFQKLVARKAGSPEAFAIFNKAYAAGKIRGETLERRIWEEILGQANATAQQYKVPLSDSKVLEVLIDKFPATLALGRIVNALTVPEDSRPSEKVNETDLALKLGQLSDDVAAMIRELCRTAHELGTHLTDTRVLREYQLRTSGTSLQGKPVTHLNIFLSNVLAALYFPEGEEAEKKPEDGEAMFVKEEETLVWETLFDVVRVPITSLQEGDTFYLQRIVHSWRWRIEKNEDGKVFAKSHFCSTTEMNPKLNVWVLKDKVKI